MTRTGHQAAVAKAVQQFINPGQRVQDAELLLNPLPEILAPTDTALRVCRRTVYVLADLLLLGPGQMAMIASPVIDESIQALGVVTIDPPLHRAPTRTQRRGDVRGRLALHGQDYHLNTIAKPSLSSASQPL